MTMRAGKPLLAIVALALQGCEPLTNDECYDPDSPAVVPIDLTGTWTGMAREAISMRYELRQAHWLTNAARDEARLTGTVSITIPGPVEASDSVSGWTLALPNCDETRIRRQSVRVFAHLTVMPNDQLEFPLHIDMLYGTVEDGEIDAGLIYNGPTAVTFDANGEVTGIELDSFTDTDFKLTRGDGRPSKNAGGSRFPTFVGNECRASETRSLKNPMSPPGLEPGAYCLGGSRSIHLSYGDEYAYTGPSGMNLAG